MTKTVDTPTLADIGRIAGVSAATASRALNGQPSVDPDRAARIHAAADQLGYLRHDNDARRRLVRVKTADRSSAPTLTDVGRIAGVSAATASRALNGHPSVDPARAARIHAAADQLGYVVNATARAVSGGTSATIALVLTDSDQPVSLTLVQSVAEAAAAHRLAVLVASIALGSGQAGTTIQQLRTHQPRCIIIVDPQRAAHCDRDLSIELDHHRRHGGHVIWITPPTADVVSPVDYHRLNRRLGAAAVDAATSPQPAARIGPPELRPPTVEQHQSESRTP